MNRLLIASAFCAGILPASWAYAQTCSQRITEPFLGYGMGVDTSGQIWVAGQLDRTLYRYSANGLTIDEFFTNGFGQYGVAVTPIDDNVWVAVGGFKETPSNEVLRFDNLGNLLEVIPIELNSQDANEPNAVAVDANGVVWVTSIGDVAVARINPIVTFPDPPENCATDYNAEVCSRVISEVDIDWPYAVDEYAKPHNYSDMTGMVTLLTTGTGTWTTVHDGGVYGAAWTTVTWIGDPSGSQPPPGTSLDVAVRAADKEADLPSATCREGITNGDGFENVWGRFTQPDRSDSARHRGSGRRSVGQSPTDYPTRG